MRVLMTADTLGGVFSYAVQLAGALAEHGIETVLYTMGGPLSKEQRAQLDVVAGLRLIETEHALEWMADPWRGVDEAARELRSLARELRVDVVHVNGFAHAGVDYGVPVVCVAHSCVCSWWRAVHGGEAPAEWDEYRARVAHGLRRAQAIVAPSRAALDAVLACYDVGAGLRARSSVIANGRDASAYQPKIAEPFVLAAGRAWDRAKNLQALEVCASRLPWPVFCAGSTDGPRGEHAQLSGLISLGVLGSRELAAWLGCAAVFCAPARYEPFGLSILEAALSGCALVLGDIPSLREIWSDAAVYVPPDDTRALRAALLELIEDGLLRTTLSARALARGRLFSEAAMAAGYAALYAKVSSQQLAPMPWRAS
jgi:glycosyltransferase involved in cell wall biosynthesis